MSGRPGWGLGSSARGERSNRGVTLPCSARHTERRSSAGEKRGTIPHRRGSSRESAWPFPPHAKEDTHGFILPARQFLLRRFFFLFVCLGCRSVRNARRSVQSHPSSVATSSVAPPMARGRTTWRMRLEGG